MIEDLKASVADAERRNQDIKAEFEEKTRQFQLLLYAINVLGVEASDKDNKDTNPSGTKDPEPEMRGQKRKLEASDDSAVKKQKVDETK